MKTRISPDVEAVIRRSQITGNQLVLPEQLSRPLYEAVNKVLANAGGKWNRKARAHVFPGDPLSNLGLALETGISINVQQEKQAFYTPRALADRMAFIGDVKGKVVLEPSAGEGALAEACHAAGATRVHCFEKDEAAARVLAAKGFAVAVCDFLTVPPEVNFQYDRVIMNPPFAKRQDIAHILHAQRFLKLDGILIAICANGPVQQKLLRPLASFWTPLPAGSFAPAGTNVNTAMLGMRSESAHRR